MTTCTNCQTLQTEIDRLREGRFTEAEFQNLCHNADVQDGFERFVSGCAEYQHQLFGASERDALNAEINRLRTLIHTPHTHDFIEALPLEAAYQIDHWGVEHDAGKEPQDYFWLLGYLAGKALQAILSNDLEKAKHHTISSAAVLLNWYRRLVGDDKLFQPGCDKAAQIKP